MTERPPLPADVARSVRQRCGFGCVVCGLPIYQYDHLLGWADTQRHVADEITLLCDFHHSEKTRGLGTAKQVAEANASPFNKSNGITAPYGLNLAPGDMTELELGQTSFVSPDTIFGIVVDNQPLLWLGRTADELLMNFVFMDEYNIPQLIVEDNQLRFASDLWDVRFEGQRLSLRDGQGDIRLQVYFDLPSKLVVERAKFRYNGVKIEVTKERVTIGNKQRSFQNCLLLGQVGLTVGNCPTFPGDAMTHTQFVSRYSTS